MAEPPNTMLHARDDDGVPYAIELVVAERWEPRLAVAPAAEVADVRIVRLARGPVPPALPPWLRVEVAGAPVSGGAPRPTTRVAEGAAAYRLDRIDQIDQIDRPDASDNAEAAASESAQGDGDGGAAVAAALWPWSPHHRPPRARLEEFLRAGAAALRHPEGPPLTPAHQQAALSAFGRHGALAPLAALRAAALERWLHVRFGDPDVFAAAVLIERIAAASAEDAALLRFVREAQVPAGDPALADLAVDRTVLLEQASPWRYFEAVPLAPAFAALRAWQRRYRRAYAQRYREAVAERGVLLTEAAEGEARFAALERLNGIAALGAPEGRTPLARLRAAVAALGAMPDAPQAEAAITATIALGVPNPLVRELRAAVAEAERALQSRLRRLAAALAGCALDRAGADDDLARTLAALAASEVDHIDRVLDDRLTAHIERLLADGAPSPLARVARRFPEVTLATLEAAVEEFRQAAGEAIAASQDGRAALGGGIAADEAGDGEG